MIVKLISVSLKSAFVIIGLMIGGFNVAKAQQVGVQESPTENARNRYVGKYSNSSTLPKPKTQGSNRYYAKVSSDSGRVNTIKVVADTPIATPYVRFVPASKVQLQNKKKTISKSK